MTEIAESFGARLKAQRECRQVTLETIAEQTKIRVGLLEALERDDVSRWPDGIFRRSYFRNYANAIGLDPEAAVREFLALYPDPVEEPLTAILADVEPARPGPPRMRLHYLLDSAIRAVSKPFDREQPDSFSPAVVSAAISAEQAAAETVGSPHDNGGGETTVDVGDFNGALAGQIEVESYEERAEESPAVQADLAALAQLCTRIVEAASASDLEALLGEAARILHAIGLIVWPWDPARGVLVPSLSHGYPPRTMARLPTVSPDADNPVGAAFRSSARQVIAGGGSATGAIVVPLTTPGGCVGVLAVECTNGVEQDAAVQALATILAAQLSLPVNHVQHVQTEPSRHAIA